MENRADQGSALQQLRRLVSESKSRPFPDDPVEDPEVDEVRIHLKEYDRFVSTLVIQAVQGGKVDVTMEQKAPNINVHLSALHQNKPDALKPLIQRYRQFKERLDTMLDLAVQASKERGPHQD